jgi:DNA uptake protein ComE-like DNA-binding protein
MAGLIDNRCFTGKIHGRRALFMKTVVSFIVFVGLLFPILSVSDSAAEGKLEINGAAEEELMSVKGIGEKRAQAILEYIRSSEGITDMILPCLIDPIVFIP